jgi:hypothetical protein
MKQVIVITASVLFGVSAAVPIGADVASSPKQEAAQRASITLKAPLATQKRLRNPWER